MYNKIKIFLASLSFLVLIASCTEDENNPTNGDGSQFSANVEISTDDGSMNFQYAAASYNSDDDKTTIVMTNSLDAILSGEGITSGEYLFITYKGQGTGTFNLVSEDNNVMLNVDSKTYNSTSGTIEVTQFDDPGGKCVFSLDVDLITQSGETMSLSAENVEVNVFNNSEVDDNGDDGDDGDDDNGDDDGDDDEDIHEDISDFNLVIENEVINYTNISLANAFYYPEENATIIQITGIANYNDEEKTIQINITFEGNQTGNVNLETTEGNKNFIIIIIGQTPYYFEEGTVLTVSEYGQMGENITLNTSGNLKSEVEGEIKTVQNFELSIKRSF